MGTSPWEVNKMKRRLTMAVVLSLVTFACIHVVVNVYFPESEAKGALATLEGELLKGSPAASPAPAPAPKKAPNDQPQKGSKESAVIGLFQTQTAYAAERVTEEEIYNRIKSMPRVVEAYQRMAARLSRVNALRDEGLVGEGNDGMLHPRGQVDNRRDQRTIEDENADRRIVIHGLAKASLQAQGLKADSQNLDRVLPDAAATFAALRRDKAHSGWWVQKPDGSWKRK
jgi:hypothetical protein